MCPRHRTTQLLRYSENIWVSVERALVFMADRPGFSFWLCHLLVFDLKQTTSPLCISVFRFEKMGLTLSLKAIEFAKLSMWMDPAQSRLCSRYSTNGATFSRKKPKKVAKKEEKTFS